MAVPADKVVLNDDALESAVVGGFLMQSAAFEAYGPDLSAEWLSDPFLRYLFEGALAAVAGGGRISPEVMAAALPEDCGGVPRQRLIARVCSDALPANSLPPAIRAIKEKWARRVLLSTGASLQTAAESFGDDPYETALTGIAALDGVHASTAQAKTSTLGDAAAALIASHANPAALKGHTTGLAALDLKLNGYVPGQFYIFAGRPGMGKSALLTSSLRRTAASGVGVAVFSLEMTEVEVASRCISDMFDDVIAPPFGALQRGNFDMMWQRDLEAAAEALKSYPLFVDDTARLGMGEVAARARKAKARFEAAGYKLGVIAIDHVGLVAPSGRYMGNRVAENGETSNLCRALAKETGACVVGFAQLSREVEQREDKRPILSDLRWSGDFEQDAHVVAFLYRQAYYLQQDPFADPAALSAVRWKLEMLIRKNRNGPPDDVELWCSIAHASIRDN